MFSLQGALELQKTHVFDLEPGQQCQGYFGNILYSVEIVANGALKQCGKGYIDTFLFVGNYVQMKAKQKLIEREAEGIYTYVWLPCCVDIKRSTNYKNASSWR